MPHGVIKSHPCRVFTFFPVCFRGTFHHCENCGSASKKEMSRPRYILAVAIDSSCSNVGWDGRVLLWEDTLQSFNFSWPIWLTDRHLNKAIPQTLYSVVLGLFKFWKLSVEKKLSARFPNLIMQKETCIIYDIKLQGLMYCIWWWPCSLILPFKLLNNE